MPRSRENMPSTSYDDSLELPGDSRIPPGHAREADPNYHNPTHSMSVNYWQQSYGGNYQHDLKSPDQDQNYWQDSNYPSYWPQYKYKYKPYEESHYSYQPEYDNVPPQHYRHNNGRFSNRHPRHKTNYNPNRKQVRKNDYHVPQGSGRRSAEGRPSNHTPHKRDLNNSRISETSKEDEKRKATIDKVKAHIKNFQKKDLNDKLLERDPMMSPGKPSENERATLKETTTDIHLTADDFRSIGSRSKTSSSSKSNANSENVLQGIGFIDQGDQGPNASVNVLSFEILDEEVPTELETCSSAGLPESEGRDRIVVNTDEPGTAGQSNTESDNVQKIKQHVLQKILSMDRTKRSQLIEDPKSSSSRFIMEHLVREHRTTFARRLTQLRFHVNPETHTFYKEFGESLTNAADLDISELPDALVEQVHQILTSNSNSPCLEQTVEEEEEDIQVLEPPAKPPPLCIDLDDPVEEVGEQTAQGNSEEAAKEPEPTPSQAADYRIDLGDEETVLAEQPSTSALPEETSVTQTEPIPPVAEATVTSFTTFVARIADEHQTSMNNLSTTQEICNPGTSEQVNRTAENPPVRKTSEDDIATNPKNLSQATSTCVTHNIEVKSALLKDLLKEEQSLYAELRSLDNKMRELVSKRQYVMRLIAGVKRREFQVLSEIKLTPQVHDPHVETSTTQQSQPVAAAAAAPALEPSHIAPSETERRENVNVLTAKTTEVDRMDADSTGSPRIEPVHEPQDPIASVENTQAPEVVQNPRMRDLVNQFAANGFTVSIDQSLSTEASQEANRKQAKGQSSSTLQSNKRQKSNRKQSAGTSGPKSRKKRKTAEEAPDLQSEASGGSERPPEEKQEEDNYTYRSLPPHKGSVECIHTRGPLLFTGSADKTVHVYDINTGSLLERIEGHKGSIKFVQSISLRTPSHLFPPTVSSHEYLQQLDVITGCSDGFVRRFDFSAAKPQVTHEISTRYPVTCMARTDQQSRVFLLGAVLGYIYEYNPRHANLKLADYKEESDIVCLHITQLLARRVIIISAKNSPVVVRDVRSGVLLMTLRQGLNVRRICSISAIGDYVYCADAARNVIVCDSANSGATVREIKLPSSAVKTCASARLVYLGCYDGVIRVIDSSTLTVISEISSYKRKDLTSMHIDEDNKIHLGNRAGEIGWVEAIQK